MIARIIACAQRTTRTLLLVGLATAWGVLSLRNTALDAVPDLSDVQVIVFSEWMVARLICRGQHHVPWSARSRLASVTAVRGQSMFGMSFVNVIFEDGTTCTGRAAACWRSSRPSPTSSPGVTPILGPDATGVGWVFEYALIDKTGHVTLQQLQSCRLEHPICAAAVPGVAEVASVGGFVKEYQVDLDPDRLAAWHPALEVWKR